MLLDKSVTSSQKDRASMAKKVMVAMSGGVDSSVAMLKIIEMGYDAFGVTMKLWDYQSAGGNISRENSCCSIEEINGAKLVCDRLGVPHYTIDFMDTFKESVIDDFAREYFSGRTPNPCVRCNSFVKWDAFLKQAELLGADLIATGHYAQIEYKDGEPILKKGVDPVKDQAYVLWGIPRESMHQTLLPLGGLNKSEVRKIAAENDLATANTPESMEICFVADGNYKRFLSDYSPDQYNKVGKGNVVENDEVVGTHPGYTHFTIGQRKGIGVSMPEPRYVQKIDVETNTITIGGKDGLYSQSCKVSNINWLIKDIAFPKKTEVQIRYNSKVSKATILMDEKWDCHIEFEIPQLSITPGQSIVFYDDIDTDVVLGGGIIEKSS